jgi:hypothetical protein
MAEELVVSFCHVKWDNRLVVIAPTATGEEYNHREKQKGISEDGAGGHGDYLVVKGP